MPPQYCDLFLKESTGMRTARDISSENISKSICPRRLGEILQQAHLVSPAQIAVATHDQQHTDIRLGEVLALRGWLKQETADFFADQWLEAMFQPQKQRLGDYLQAAALVSKEQIEEVCREQWHTGLRFGATAVLLGLIEQSTLDFFLTYLFPTEKRAGGLSQKQPEKVKVDKNSTKPSRANPLSSEPLSTDPSQSDDVQWID